MGDLNNSKARRIKEAQQVAEEKIKAKYHLMDLMAAALGLYDGLNPGDPRHPANMKAFFSALVSYRDQFENEVSVAADPTLVDKKPFNPPNS